MKNRGIIFIILLVLLSLYITSCGNSGDQDSKPLTMITEKLQDCSSGKEYYFTLSATGGIPPYSWKLAGKLPAGLKLNETTGILSGKPTAEAQTEQFEIILTDSTSKDKGKEVRRKFNLYVIAGPFIASAKDLIPLKILTDTFPVFETGKICKFYLTGYGGLPPYNWNLSGSLPDGITFDKEKGLIRGTPTRAGKWEIALQLSDMLGNNISSPQKLVLEIKSQNIQTDQSTMEFMFLTSELPMGIQGKKYYANLSAIGGMPPYQWSLESDLPNEINFDDNTAIFSGTPLTNGIYNIRVEASDSSTNTQKIKKTLKLEILPPAINRLYPLKVITDEIPVAYINHHYSTTISAHGGSYPYKFVSPNHLPQGLKLNESTGVLSGMPKMEGNHEITIEISDSSIPPGAAWKTLKFQVLSTEEKSSNPGILLYIPWVLLLITVSILVFIILKRRDAVSNEPETVTIETDSLPDARLTEPYIAVLRGSGGIQPYYWDCENEIPKGLLLENESGIIKGTFNETTAGDYPIDIIIYDADSPPSKERRTLTIHADMNKMPGEKKVFTVISNKNKLFFEGKPFDNSLKHLVDINDLDDETKAFQILISNLNRMNETSANNWVIYCQTDYPSGIEVAFKAKEIAEKHNITFYIMINSKN